MNKLELEDALDTLWEYFDQREDADWNGERFIPNEEMKLKKLVEKMQEACISKQ